MPKIILYSSPTCGYCKMAKQYFDQIEVEFEEKDVSDPKIAEEAVEASGQMGVPVIIIGEGENAKMLPGFNKEEIDKALAEVK
ncbi:glutaredoxin family protein [Patescibacteria group bacterium]